MITDLFQLCGHCWVFQMCWHIECSTFTASSFRIFFFLIFIFTLFYFTILYWFCHTLTWIHHGYTWDPWNSITSTSLFVVMLSKAHLTSHSRISGSRWVITPLWLSGLWRSSLYSSSDEYSGLISFRIDWFNLLAVWGTLKSLLQHHNLKVSILWCSIPSLQSNSHIHTWLLEKPYLFIIWTLVSN